MANAVAPMALRANANSASLGNRAAIEVAAPAARPRNIKAANDKASRLAATAHLPAHADRAGHRNGSPVADRVDLVAIAVVVAHRAEIATARTTLHRSRSSFRRRR